MVVILVNVCSEVLVEKCRAELFRPWIHKFGHEIIVHSVKYVRHSPYSFFFISDDFVVVTDSILFLFLSIHLLE